ncbi:MAG TPA: fluoride efflux transporter CrcB [Steroidobacteraceae bacterium]
MLNSIIAISVGASAGALLRWAFGLWLNAVLPPMPLGTLTSNLVGGYLVGIAVAVFSIEVNLAPEWRLLVITGFLGGLTTFSTFSAEVTSLLLGGRFAWAGAVISAHLFGSIAMTLLGMGSVLGLRKLL